MSIVVLLSVLFFTSSLSRAGFGSLFVPAFFGVAVLIVSLGAGAGFWARATAVRQSAVSAAMAAIRYLRKGSPPNLGLGLTDGSTP